MLMNAKSIYCLICRIFSGGRAANEQQWKGTADAVLHRLTADQAWAVLADFGNYYKYHPDLDTGYIVEGVTGQKGVVRFCSATKSVPPDGNLKTLWVKEKLLMIDPVRRCFSYEITENNMGFTKYIATMEVVPQSSEGKGCRVEWSFVADPVQGWTKESFQTYLDQTLEALVRNIEVLLLFS